MKNILFLFVFACFSLYFAQRSDAQCYVRLEDASGFNTDAYQDTLQAAAAKLCAIFDSTGFAGQFKVYDFGFYLHQENTTGGYPEPFLQKMAAVQDSSPYYLLFGKQTDKSGVYTRFWVDLVLPDTGKFGCINLISPGYRQHITDKFGVLSNEIYERSGRSTSKYNEAEITLMDSLIVFFVDMIDCCEFNKLNRGSVCGECLTSEFQFEKILDDNGFSKTDCTILAEIDSNNTNNEKINLLVTLQGVNVDIDNQINEYVSLYKVGHPNGRAKIHTFKFPDICLAFNSFLATAIIDTTFYELVIITGVLGKIGHGGKVFAKIYEKNDNQIPENGPGYVYVFSERGLFLKRYIGSKHHGIFFNDNSSCLLMNFNKNETCGDIIARNSWLYISEQNILFLKQMQKQCDAQSREFGGVVSINADRSMIFYECTECPYTETTISADNLLNVQQYPASSLFVSVWHTHPSAQNSQWPSGYQKYLVQGIQSGDMFIYSEMYIWHGNELNIGPFTDQVWKLPGGIGLIAGDKGITVYRHAGDYYDISYQVNACNQILNSNGGGYCYKKSGENLASNGLVYYWVSYDLSTFGP
jgi:hypothetical protein